MPGNSRALAPLVPLAGLAAATLLGGCPTMVGQAAHSGPDVQPKGAEKIKLEDGEGRTVDTVTYPGGDRVDWKVFAVPKGPPGRLEIKLRWLPARPGLDVAFEVYDANYNRIGWAKPTPGTDNYLKKVVIEHAKPGKYYLNIYAPRRVDAARYQVVVRFEAGKGGSAKVASAAPGGIPYPPTLPALPGSGGGGGGAGAAGGGAAGAGGGGAAAGGAARGGAAAAGGAARGGAAAAGGGAARGGAAAAGGAARGGAAGGGAGAGGAAVAGGGAATAQPPATAAKPVKALVVSYQVTSNGSVILTVDKGKTAGVKAGWVGNILIGSTARPLQGGQFKVTRVTSAESVGKVKVSVDQIRANHTVLLSPPAQAP